MRSTALVVTAALAAALFGFGLAAKNEPDLPRLPTLGVDVEIAEPPDNPGVLEATFALRDLESGETIARPRLLLPGGESGEIEQGSPGRVFRFAVDATNKTSIRYEVTLVAGGRELVISRGSFDRGATVAQPESTLVSRP